MKRSKIQLRKLKIVKNFNTLLSDIQCSDIEKSTVWRYYTSFNDDGCDADLFLFDIRFRYENAIENLLYDLEQEEDKEIKKKIRSDLKILKRFYNLCPKNSYVIANRE